MLENMSKVAKLKAIVEIGLKMIVETDVIDKCKILRDMSGPY